MEKKETNTMAASKPPYSKIAIVAGILAGLGVVAGPLATIPAFILGIIALRKIKRHTLRGKQLAWFGIIFLPFQIIFLSVFIPYTMNTPEYKNTKRGEDAVNNMNTEEKEFLERELSTLTNGSTKEDVKKILGEEKELGYVVLGDSDGHNCPIIDPKCTIIASYFDGKLSSIAWSSPGRFFYSKEY